MDRQLVEYIQEQISVGYSPSAIKEHLVTHGYDPSGVDSAFRYVGHVERQEMMSPSESSGHSRRTMVIAITLIGVILALAVPSAYFYFSGQEQAQLMLRISINPLAVNPGGTIDVSTSVSQLNPKSLSSVSVDYLIIGTPVSRTEQIPNPLGKDSVAATATLAIPSPIDARTYTVKATAHYSGRTAFSTATFSVAASGNPVNSRCVEQWSCDPWQPSACSGSESQTRICVDLNSCGTTALRPAIRQACASSEPPQHQPAQPTPPVPAAPGSSGLTVWERLTQAKELAKTNPSQALALCPGFEIELHRDQCYLDITGITLDQATCTQIISDRTTDKCYANVARLKKDSTLCEQITQENRKDSCYMDFVNAKDYTVCDKLKNQYLIDICVSQRDAPTVNLVTVT